jgi:hypothetical protein
MRESRLVVKDGKAFLKVVFEKSEEKLNLTQVSLYTLTWPKLLVRLAITSDPNTPSRVPPLEIPSRELQRVP